MPWLFGVHTGELVPNTAVLMLLPGKNLRHPPHLWAKIFSEAFLLRLCLALLIAAGLLAQPDTSPTEEVRRAEIAFAKTMADRDHAAFRSFLAAEAIFVGPNRVLRGANQVAAGWKPFYEGSQAPFSWEPDQIQVLDSGTMALSSGPVRNPAGKRVGTFNSIWRRETDGKWRIVIDHGCPPCDCTAR
jgi:ketosteroid isomerase-like protein